MWLERAQFGLGVGDRLVANASRKSLFFHCACPQLLLLVQK